MQDYYIQAGLAYWDQIPSVHSAHFNKVLKDVAKELTNMGYNAHYADDPHDEMGWLMIIFPSKKVNRLALNRSIHDVFAGHHLDFDSVYIDDDLYEC